MSDVPNTERNAHRCPCGEQLEYDHRDPRIRSDEFEIYTCPACSRWYTRDLPHGTWTELPPKHR